MQGEQPRKLSRRGFLRGTSMLAAGTLLAACAPTAPASAPAAGSGGAEAPAASGKTANYWVGWGNLQPAWEMMIETDEYKDMMGDNSVEFNSAMTAEGLLTAVAAGDPPDGASNTQYLDYMARGVLQPIDDWVASSSIVTKADYLEGTWNDAFFQGIMYGVPANEGFIRYGLNYNAQMVADAGLDPDSPPETWEDCLAWHEALTQFDDAGNMTQVGLDPYDAMGGSVAVQNGFFPSVSWGWEWFNADTGEFNLNSDEMIQAFEIMGEFYKIAGPDNMAGMRQVEGQGGWGGSFNAGVQAMIIEGYWHPGETQIQQPEVAEHNRATWAPVPASRAGTKVQGTGGHYVVFFREAPNTDVMFSVAEYLNTDVAMNIIFENTGWLPGRSTFIDTIDPSVFPGLEFYFRSVDETTEWSSPSRCPITAFVSTQYLQLREAQYRGEVTAAEAAAEFQSRCEAEYEAAGL